MAKTLGGFHPVMVKAHIDTTTAAVRRNRRCQLKRDRWTLAIVGLLALVLAVFGLGMNSDADLEQGQYCRNVAAGNWPDYEGTYKQACGGRNPPRFTADLTK